MYLFSFEKYGKLFNVYDTIHINQKRDNANHIRNQYYTHEKLHDILNLGVGSLMEFRDRPTGITFFNDKGNTNAVLAVLEGQRITIITLLENTKRQPNDVFRGCPHSFLRNYRFFRPTREDLDLELFELKIVQPKKATIKKKVKTKPEVKASEDEMFLETMKNIKRI